MVTAKHTGSATIIVSNGDLSGAVSVIVNRDTESSVAEPAADSTEAENTSEQIFDENTDVSETPVISEQMLYELVRSRQINESDRRRLQHHNRRKEDSKL
ncbi:MAG: hypothetical protein ACLTLY_03965 [Agathobacter rectalis]